MYILTYSVHEFETQHHVHFLTSSVSVPHTNKCILCMCTYIIMHTLYSHLLVCQIQIKPISFFWGEERLYDDNDGSKLYMYAVSDYTVQWWNDTV